MLLASGFFDKVGNACIKISVAGAIAQTGIEFDAIIDTGFTGFLSIPTLRALPIGLILTSTTQVTLADGTTKGRYLAGGVVHILGEEQSTLTKAGLIVLEETGADVLVGMDFLRGFGLSLGVSSKHVLLFDQEWLDRNAASAGNTEKSKL